MKRLVVVPLLLLTVLRLPAQTWRYAMAFSGQADRSAASFLTNASVLTGNAYVFTSLASAVNMNRTGIASTCYWLDRAATGMADRCEYGIPYDLKGSNTCASGPGSCGGPWNTGALADGWHHPDTGSDAVGWRDGHR